MLVGFLKSDWHYQKPISDPILLWCLLALWTPLRWLYEITGKSSPTLARWELMLFVRAAMHTRIQEIVYFDPLTETEKTLSTGFHGGKRFILNIQESENMSSADMKRHGIVCETASASTQGEE